MKDIRKRRSTGEVREAILKASVKLFQEYGYEATGTKAIAAAALVQEPLIFRHFGSKARLLEEAVLFSLETFVRGFEREFESPQELFGASVVQYTRQLYELLTEERELIIALFALSGPNRSDQDCQIHRSLARLFDRLEEMGRRHHKPGGLDPWFAVRLTFCLVVSSIVLEDWLFPRGDVSTKERLVEALVQYVVGGTTWRGRPMAKHAPITSVNGAKRAVRRTVRGKP
ncbi:TetR/AcrR family transcriptional regulator [Paraburkholderia oxyphila]|uniref:TetR/AcrR family transcriptional regulator n=1 Tax=Paraburkholderia oxyphila TaxID=614212 RepID=UPI001FE037B8|nr:TetR/AcrR family transcriptional regulator [Paraburkholderia oxyphila]